VLLVLGEIKGGEPVPLLSEVNRMLGKVDELAVTDTHAIPFNLGRRLLLMGL
jgi:hypothetical protein